MLSEMTAADANCISYSKQNNIGDEKINQSLKLFRNKQLIIVN